MKNRLTLGFYFMKITSMNNIIYPDYRTELLNLVASEQKELTTLFSDQKSRNIDNNVKSAMAKCHKRAKRVIEILEEIRLPSI